MKSMLTTIWFALLLFGLGSPSYAGLATGTFSGTVYGAWGTSDGFDLTKLNGQALTGTFTYDPSALLSGAQR